MKAKLMFNNGWNLEFENHKKSSLFYWMQLHPYYLEFKTLKEFNIFREIRKFATYDCNEINFTGDIGIGFIRRRK
jgi:hypothetical protein